MYLLSLFYLKNVLKYTYTETLNLYFHFMSFMQFLSKFNSKKTVRCVIIHKQYTAQFKIAQILYFAYEI